MISKVEIFRLEQAAMSLGDSGALAQHGDMYDALGDVYWDLFNGHLEIPEGLELDQIEDWFFGRTVTRFLTQYCKARG